MITVFTWLDATATITLTSTAAIQTLPLFNAGK